MKVSSGDTVNGRYKILSEIGRGSLAAVYRAQDLHLVRDVALKVMRPCLTDGLARFRQESQLLAKLSHPGAVTVYSCEQLADSTPFLVMELLQGRSLRAFLSEKGALDFNLAESFLRQVCQALSHAHKIDLVHRDLSPANIFVIESENSCIFKILDFGLSRLYDGEKSREDTLSETGMLIGNPHYMSPELCTGGTVDARSDIYALGCILYQCISGKTCFREEAAARLIYHQQHHYPLEPLLSWDSDQQEDLFKNILLRCLQKNANLRFQSAEEILQSLESKNCPFDKGKLHSWQKTKHSLPAMVRNKRTLSFILAGSLMLAAYAEKNLLQDNVFIPLVSVLPEPLDERILELFSKANQKETALRFASKLAESFSHKGQFEKAAAWSLKAASLRLDIESSPQEISAMLEKVNQNICRCPESTEKKRLLIEFWQILETAEKANPNIAHSLESKVFTEFLNFKSRDKTILKRCFTKIISNTQGQDLSCTEASSKALISYFKLSPAYLQEVEITRLDDLTQVLLDRGFKSLAISLLEERLQAARLSGDSVNSLKYYIAKLEESGNPKRSHQLINEILNSGTEDSKLLGETCLLSASIYYYKNDWKRALSACNKGLDIMKDDLPGSLPRFDIITIRVVLLHALNKEAETEIESKKMLQEAWSALSLHPGAASYAAAVDRIDNNSRAMERIKHFQSVWLKSMMVLASTGQYESIEKQLSEFYAWAIEEKPALSPQIKTAMKELLAQKKLTESGQKMCNQILDLYEG